MMLSTFATQTISASTGDPSAGLNPSPGLQLTRDGQSGLNGNALNTIQFSDRASSDPTLFTSSDRLTSFSAASGVVLPLVPSLLPGSDLNAGVYDVQVQAEVNPTLPGVQTPGDWFSQTFQTQKIADLVRTLDSDGSLSRNDMISIFRATEDGNLIDAGELTDLRAIVSNATQLGMANYVKVLADKIVNGSIANAYIQGYAIGNLYAGSSGTQMEWLVDKHFYGIDHPDTVIPGTAGSSTKTITYGYVSGSLFGLDGTPALPDIQQGFLGDCYFLSSLGAVLLQNPTAIQNMFIDNGDNTYTVRFFGEQNGNPTSADYVTVDRYLPVNVTVGLSGGYQFAAYDATGNGGIWVALLEKAFAQFAEDGLAQRPANASGRVLNSYGSIEGGWGAQTMPTITGTPGIIFSNNPGYAQVSTYGGGMLSLQQIAADLAQGHSITADTIQLPTRIDRITGIVGGHEYVVIGANLTSGTVTLYNPWGDSSYSTGSTDSADSTGDFLGYKVVSYSDFLTHFSDIDLV